MGSPGAPEDRHDADEVAADEMVDEAERESYPASDPQSFWAGPDEPPADHRPERERRS
ncbi:MAG: hypothetical protein ABSF84_10725 [Acidimicrobiales bacterium]|jgi:hypothetical protein